MEEHCIIFEKASAQKLCAVYWYKALKERHFKN